MVTVRNLVKKSVGYNMWDSDVLIPLSGGMIHQIPPKIEQSPLMGSTNVHLTRQANCVMIVQRMNRVSKY